MHKEKKDILTSKGKKEVDRDDVMQDGDAEAGVDPHVEQINDMPMTLMTGQEKLSRTSNKEKKDDSLKHLFLIIVFSLKFFP